MCEVVQGNSVDDKVARLRVIKNSKIVFLKNFLFERAYSWKKAKVLQIVDQQFSDHRFDTCNHSKEIEILIRSLFHKKNYYSL